jgi:hypothetical protein
VKLIRPYIPIAVRVQVAERQVRETSGYHPKSIEHPEWSMRFRLSAALEFLFGEDAKAELHHRPALCNRWKSNTGEYVPAANDPEYLVYLVKGEHDIETRVRGVGAQRSDLGQRRYLKRLARNRAHRIPIGYPITPHRGFFKVVKPKAKRPWRWPKGRKLRSKPINARWRRRKVGG